MVVFKVGAIKYRDGNGKESSWHWAFAFELVEGPW